MLAPMAVFCFVFLAACFVVVVVASFVYSAHARHPNPTIWLWF